MRERRTRSARKLSRSAMPRVEKPWQLHHFQFFPIFLHHHRIIIPSAQSVFVEISGLALQVPHNVIDLLLHPFRSPPSSRVKFPLGGTARPARIEYETKQESPRRMRRTRRWRLKRKTSGWKPCHLFLEMGRLISK